MPEFVENSKKIIDTCHIGIRQVAYEIIKHFDCTPLYGYRTPEEQFELFKIGRKMIGGLWIVVNELMVVTNCDGKDILSNHNKQPSDALDLAPYPLNWRDRERMYYFAGQVKAEARYIGVGLIWGGDWDDDTEVRDQTFFDLVHFERVREV